MNNWNKLIFLVDYNIMYNDNHEKNILKTADALANAHVFFADTLF